MKGQIALCLGGVDRPGHKRQHFFERREIGPAVLRRFLADCRSVEGDLLILPRTLGRGVD